VIASIGAVMTEDENQLVIEHARAIAKILYKNAPVEELTSLGKIYSINIIIT
jgi:hypothetical protein